MFLSREEAERIGLRRWLHTLQMQVKSGKSPKFPLSGPTMLKVRKRTFQGGGGIRGSVTGVQTSFNGGTEFTVSDIIAVARPEKNGYEVMLTMVPVDLRLAAEIASMSITLNEATDIFDDLHDWFRQHDETAKSRSLGDPQLSRPAIKAEDNAERGVW